jgi:hypothetical protein
MQFGPPAHALWRKQLNLHVEAINHAHVVQHTGLDDFCPCKCWPGPVHRTPAFRAEISRDGVATIGNLRYGLKGPSVLQHSSETMTFRE